MANMDLFRPEIDTCLTPHIWTIPFPKFQNTIFNTKGSLVYKWLLIKSTFTYR